MELTESTEELIRVTSSKHMVVVVIAVATSGRKKLKEYQGIRGCGR